MNETGELMPGWMVESAYGYAKLAQLALGHGSLALQSEINAAISVEILLKSLQYTPVRNVDYGTVKTQFEGQHGHDLCELYRTIPEATKTQLKLSHYEWIFSKKKNVFTMKRYPYEPQSAGLGLDTDLLHTAGRMIPKIVDFFVEKGSQDPWLLTYRADRERFQLPTGISIGGWVMMNDRADG